LARAFGLPVATQDRPRGLVMIADRSQRFLVGHTLRSRGYDVLSVPRPSARILGQRFNVAVLRFGEIGDVARLRRAMLAARVARRVEIIDPRVDGCDATAMLLAIERELAHVTLPSVRRARQENAPGSSCSCRRVMMVDDDPDITATTTLLLEALGYDVITAADGAAALRALSRDSPVAAILLDLRMSGMDGWTFRARQLENPSLREVPVIAVTAERLTDAAVVGARAVLRKPFDAAALAAALDAFATRCAACAAVPTGLPGSSW
jgi:CheY-like chemotaxis protein